MRETKKPSVAARVPCVDHGEIFGEAHPLHGLPPKTVPWTGDVRCAVCRRMWLCDELEDKRVYPQAPDDGFCVCGSALFPGVGAVSTGGVFSAQPVCAACARIVWARQNPTEKENAPSP